MRVSLIFLFLKYTYLTLREDKFSLMLHHLKSDGTECGNGAHKQ